MNPLLSIYLDFVRFAAAAFVFLVHSNQRWLIAQELPFGSGHFAVIIFFVLSGYVIAHVADTKERTFSKYAASRCARLYSMAVIAVLVTPVLDWIGRLYWPALYSTSPHDHIAIRIVASLLFLGEAWKTSMMSFSNLPYWSLNYEAWYYVAFGFMQFFNGGRGRSLWLVALCLALGPKFMLLAPCWLIGVWLYRTRCFDRLSTLSAFCGFVASVAAIFAYRTFHIQETFGDLLRARIGVEHFEQLSWAQYFGADILLSVIVAANFGTVKKLCSLGALPAQPVIKAVRFLSKLTFPLYIFHYPFLLMWGAIIHGDNKRWTFYVATFALTMISASLLGTLGERLRPSMVKVFARLFSSEFWRRAYVGS